MVKNYDVIREKHKKSAPCVLIPTTSLSIILAGIISRRTDNLPTPYLPVESSTEFGSTYSEYSGVLRSTYSVVIVTHSGVLRKSAFKIDGIRNLHCPHSQTKRASHFVVKLV
jgi:hypothetical protein